MKKSKILMGLCLFLTSYSGAQNTLNHQFSVEGRLSNLKKDLKITLTYKGDDGKYVDKTSIIQHGKFLFKGNIANPVKAQISYLTDKEIVDPISKEKFYEMEKANFFLTSGTTTIKGQRLRNAEITGTPLQNEYNGYQSLLRNFDQETDSLYKLLYQKEDSITSKNDLKTKAIDRLSQIKKEKNALSVNFITTHPDSYLSLSLLSDLTFLNIDDSTALRLANSLDKEIKSMKEWKNLSGKLVASTSTAVGSKYIDFTKKDINGNDFTLSSVRGKYVLLDFWGSWCGPCRASHPHLKEIAKKYNSKGLVIIGIANEKSKDIFKCEESWKKAVQEDEMTWIQLLNNYENNKINLVKTYSVEGFPTKIVLDKEGKIFCKILGNNPDKLDEKLKELFGE